MAFIDTFTEASLTNLESHTPDTGTAWTLVSGPGPAQISGGTGWLRAKTATASVYACDDQGSANNYVEVVYNLQADTSDCIVASRLVDSNNAIGWEIRGTGGIGTKLTKLVGGVATYLISYQGVDNSTARVECDGTTIRLYDGGVQVGTDQTVSDFSTETTQGLIVKKNANVDWLDSFEAGALASGTTIALNPATETDTAQPVGKVKFKAIGQALSADTALAITPALVGATIVAVGQAVESDLAQAVAASKLKAVGQASEADTAQAIAPRKVKAIGQAVETDSAQAITSLGTKTIAVGLVTETDFAQAIAAYKRLGILQPVETDSAHSIAAIKRVAVGQAIETDAAQAMVVSGGAAFLTVDLIAAPARETLNTASARETLNTAPTRANLIESRHAIHG